jgi:hypothetical protein
MSETEEPDRDDVYQLRGRTVSHAGRVEWCIHHLATLFAGSKQTDRGRQWEDVRATRGGAVLTPDSVSRSASSVPTSIRAMLRRTPPSLSTPLASNSGWCGSTDVGANRPSSSRSPTSRRSFGASNWRPAIEVIGQALDDDDRKVLRDRNTLAWVFLIGRT